MLVLANNFQTYRSLNCTNQKLPILSEYYDSAQKYNMTAARPKAQSLSIHPHLA